MAVLPLGWNVMMFGKGDDPDTVGSYYHEFSGVLSRLNVAWFYNSGANCFRGWII